MPAAPKNMVLSTRRREMDAPGSTNSAVEMVSMSASGAGGSSISVGCARSGSIVYVDRLSIYLGLRARGLRRSDFAWGLALLQWMQNLGAGREESPKQTKVDSDFQLTGRGLGNGARNSLTEATRDAISVARCRRRWKRRGFQGDRRRRSWPDRRRARSRHDG